MSLTSALGIAQTALLNTSRQTTVVSRNIADANNPDYSRRYAVAVTTEAGARVVEIRRSTSEVLFRHNLGSLSALAAQQTIVAGTDLLAMSVNGPDHATSAATMLGRFQQALQTYIGTPGDASVAETAVEAARQLVGALNSGAGEIQSFRTDMDRQITTAVKELNSLLSDFERINAEVVGGTKVGRDVSEALDKRDALLKKIGEYVPVSTLNRADNDLALLTGSGVMLFDVVARPVSFQPIAGHAAGVDGNAIFVDGVPVAAGQGGNTTANGKLAAMVQLRDDVAGGMQAQLDEIARGLITAFAEKDPAGIGPDVAGLFTWDGAPGIPADGTLEHGLAGTISINADFDTRAGRNPHLLRDGNAYLVNTEAGSGFTGLLTSYQDRLEAPITFDPAAGVQSTTSVIGYSTEAIGWFEAIRQDSARAVETKSALHDRTSMALSNITGVNIDEELTLLLDLEHTYQASARLMSAVDEMLRTLLNIIR